METKEELIEFLEEIVKKEELEEKGMTEEEQAEEE